jgi:cytosine deaminase
LSDYGIAIGNPADIVVLDCRDGAAAVAELAQPVLGIKRGRMTFSHPAAVIHYPNGTMPDPSP